MDSLLKSLRDRVIDESESLAGLLRKCLMLGARTGSESLKQWARSELYGYELDAEVPSYRRMHTPPISVTSRSGNTLASNIQYHRAQLSSKAREAIPETIEFKQPIEELESLSGENNLYISGFGLPYAKALWNEELGGFFEEIIDMKFVISGSVMNGVLGQIRTKLVEIVSDLTSDSPLEELPRAEQVDTAMSQHIGEQYITTIHSNSGATAIGTSAVAQEGMKVDDVLRLFEGIRDIVDEAPQEAGSEAFLEALADLETELTKDELEAGKALKKAGRLRTAAEKIGIPAINAAVSSAIQGLFSLLMSGGI